MVNFHTAQRLLHIKALNCLEFVFLFWFKRVIFSFDRKLRALFFYSGVKLFVHQFFYSIQLLVVADATNVTTTTATEHVAGSKVGATIVESVDIECR